MWNRLCPALLLVCLACGGGRSTLDLPSPLAHASVASVDFGLANCGGSGDPRAVTLTNDATALPLFWTATVDGPYTLHGPTSGQLFSHESATVTLLPDVPATAEAAFPIPGTLRFLTNDPAHPTVEVPLTAIARGATLAFPSSVDFGDVPLSATSPAVPMNVKNTGNLATDLSLSLAPGSAFAPGVANVHVEPGAAGSAVFHFTPTTWGPESGSVTMKVKGPVCGAVPSSIPLTGRGTKGVVLTSPGSLDFGLIDCGTQAGTKVVHVENHGDASFTFSAVLTTGAFYSISPSQGSLAPSTGVDLTVTPLPVPGTSAVTADLYGDTLTITTDAVGDAPHLVALHETARGAILVTNGSTTALGNRIVDDVISAPWGSIQNLGNITIAVTGSSPEGVALAPALVVPQGSGALATLALHIDPEHTTLGATDSASVALTTSGPVCGPLPSLGFTVRAVDRALDLAMGMSSLCVVGHTHRGYCMGSVGAGQWIGTPSPYAQSYEFLLQPGLVAEHVSLSERRVCWSSGTQLLCVGTDLDAPPPFPYATVVRTFAFSGPIAEVSGGPTWNDGYSTRFFVRIAGGALFAWRKEYFGEFGDGVQDTVGPVPAMGNLQDATSATVGLRHGCVSKADGSVLCAGAAEGGELGPGVPNGIVALNPVLVPGVSALRVHSGSTGTCAAQVDGSVICWGGSKSMAFVPGITDAVDVHLVVGRDDGCAVRVGGGVRCWRSAITDVPGLGGPVTKLVDGDVKEGSLDIYGVARCGLEGGGMISCWSDDIATHHVAGFD